MEMVISGDDFRRLSPACQKELLTLLLGRDGDGEPMLQYEDEVESSPVSNPQSLSSSKKLVYPLDPRQASELLSNLAEKSQQSLRMFAMGERVALADLVGEERPYKDMNDLKRSFVGAVNRRLRTVVGNRTAVLFSSDRDRQKIRVLPNSAASLRHAMGIPEPEGYMEYDANEDWEEVSDDVQTN